MSETMVKKQLESSEIQTGACHYCGQIYQFETDGKATEEQLDKWAEEKCDCVNAQITRRKMKTADKAKKKMEELFEGKFQDEREILCKAVDLIVADKITKAAIATGNGIKMSVGINAKGNIKTEITQTKKRSAET